MPNWNEIKIMKPESAFLEGYRQGREDSQNLHDDLKRMFDKAIEKINSSKTQANPKDLSANSQKNQSVKPKITILDNNPLSIASFMEDNPEVKL